MTDPRWVTAVHEAGHIVATRVLGGRSVGAVLFSAGGAAYVGDLGAFEDALMTACGPAAERLVELHTPPEVADRADLPVAETIDRDTAEDLRADLGPSDDRRIAEWAITGYEAEPDRWARRHAWIHREADLLVRRHERTILAVASELYAHGVAGLSPSKESS